MTRQSRSINALLLLLLLGSAAVSLSSAFPCLYRATPRLSTLKPRCIIAPKASRRTDDRGGLVKSWLDEGADWAVPLLVEGAVILAAAGLAANGAALVGVTPKAKDEDDISLNTKSSDRFRYSSMALSTGATSFSASFSSRKAKVYNANACAATQWKCINTEQLAVFMSGER